MHPAMTWSQGSARYSTLRMYRLPEPVRGRNAGRPPERAAGTRHLDDRPMHPTDSGRHVVARPSPSTPPAPPSQLSAYRITDTERTHRSERALAAERRIGRAAFLLDDLVRIPGTGMRLGIDPLIGLVPFLGDAVSGLMSAWIVLEAARFRLPKIVLVRMVMNA